MDEGKQFIPLLSKSGFSYQRMCSFKIQKAGFEVVAEEFPVSTITNTNDLSVKHLATHSAIDILARKSFGNVVIYLNVECKSVDEINKSGGDRARWIFISSNQESQKGFRVDKIRVSEAVYDSTEPSQLINRPVVNLTMVHVCNSHEFPLATQVVRIKPTSGSNKGIVIDDNQENKNLIHKACEQAAIAESYLFWKQTNFVENYFEKKSIRTGVNIFFIPIVVTNQELYISSITKDKVNYASDFINDEAWNVKKVEELVYNFALSPVLQKELKDKVAPYKTIDALTQNIVFINTNQINNFLENITKSINFNKSRS